MIHYALLKQQVNMKFKNQPVLGLTQSFEEGSILGFIVNNKSGKTVLFKCICGYLVPTSNIIYIDYQNSISQDMGLISETAGFLPNTDSMNDLKLLASLKKAFGDLDMKRAIQQADFDMIVKKYTGKYSLEMCEQLKVAQEIIENHSLLILNEPFSGLNKQGVSDMRSLIKELRSIGKTVLLASQNAVRIDEICDTVCLMETGKLVIIRSLVIQ